MSRGIIYVMDTVVPGLVKIGKTGTDNFNSRMRQLENNGYYNVVGLKRRFAIEVDDYDEKESLLHTIFERSQVGTSELFSLDIEIVVQLLASLEGDVVYPKKASKDDVFDEAVEQARREAEEAVSPESSGQPTRSKSDLRKIAYWKRFCSHVDGDAEMAALYGDFSKRRDNPHSSISLSLGFGIECCIEIVHRTTREALIVEIWCKTSKYYPRLYSHREDIARATSHLEGVMSWDELDEPKTSRKAEVRRECSGNDEEDFAWAVSWAKALGPVIKEILK